jgi:hypothetical protein
LVWWKEGRGDWVGGRKEGRKKGWKGREGRKALRDGRRSDLQEGKDGKGREGKEGKEGKEGRKEGKKEGRKEGRKDGQEGPIRPYSHLPTYPFLLPSFPSLEEARTEDSKREEG